MNWLRKYLREWLGVHAEGTTRFQQDLALGNRIDALDALEARPNLNGQVLVLINLEERIANLEHLLKPKRVKK